MASPDPTALSSAVAFATEKHAAHTRKGTQIPYVSHLLAVSGLVLEHGGDPEQAIAALLHDVLEDCPDVTRAGLAERFGERVARIVADCTDTLPGDTPEQKSPWRERKERYLEHLKSTPNDSLLVAACDKLHNLGALVGDLRVQGLQYMKRFNAGPMDQVWFMEEFLRRVVGRVPLRLQLELDHMIVELRKLVQGGDTATYDKDRVQAD